MNSRKVGLFLCKVKTGREITRSGGKYFMHFLLYLCSGRPKKKYSRPHLWEGLVFASIDVQHHATSRRKLKQTRVLLNKKSKHRHENFAPVANILKSKAYVTHLNQQLSVSHAEILSLFSSIFT